MPAKELEGVVRTVTRQGWDKKLLAQGKFAAATYSALYTAPTQARGVVTLIIVSNSAGATTYRLHHADTGGAASTTNQIRYDKAIGANANEDISGGPESSGIAVSPGGIIYFGSASGDCSATLYGYEETLV